MAWVYVIQNTENRFYIGMTIDLGERLLDHNNGVSKWTKYRGPWKLVWSQARPSISPIGLRPEFSQISWYDGFKRRINFVTNQPT
jgi:predicted GIY-YIG superfamily endonuclease